MGREVSASHTPPSPAWCSAAFPTMGASHTRRAVRVLWCAWSTAFARVSASRTPVVVRVLVCPSDDERLSWAPCPACGRLPSSDSGSPSNGRYRPKEMHELVSHEDIINTITRLIDAGKLPHLLLYGPAGTGKTSTILACAHRMYGKHFNSMVLELNASDDRGIDVVRDQIKEFASTRQMFSNIPKLVILDEADNMTNAAQVIQCPKAGGRAQAQID